MKFIKHKMKAVEGFELKNDELIEKEVSEVMYFAMDNSALMVFEEEYGNGLMQALQTHQSDVAIMDPSFLRALAVATYKDLSNMSDSRANAIKFKESPFYVSCVMDIEFVTDLITMVTESVFGSELEQKAKTKSTKKSGGKSVKK